MTKVTIEEINGKQCTVIRKPFDAEWVKEQLSMGNHVRMEAVYPDQDTVLIECSTKTYPAGESVSYFGAYDCFAEEDIKHTLTILPALPRKPTPEDAPLLYRYASEGLMVMIKTEGCYSDDYGIPDEEDRWEEEYEFNSPLINVGEPQEITHATLNGERVEIAIEESVDE